MNSDNLGTCKNLIYFSSFGVEHISKEIKKYIGNKNITNIFRVQTYDSVMGGYFCIGFIYFSFYSYWMHFNFCSSLIGMPIGISSFAVAIKVRLITARIKKYKSQIKKNKKEHDEMVLLAQTKLGTIEVLISKALIHSSISHDGFVSVNDVPK